MRPLAISALLVVMLAGLAITPMAQAAPPQPSCNGTIGGTQTIGPVTVFASPPCYEISIDPEMSCPLAPAEWTEARVGNVVVRVKTCGEVEDGSQAAAAPPCTCPPPPYCRTPITTTGPLANIVSVTLTSDCRIIVEVLPIIACADPLDGRKAVTQGRVMVILPCGQIDSCEPPFECYPTAAASAEVPPIVCGPTMMCTEPELSICSNDDMCNDAGCPYPVGNEAGTDVTVAGLRVTHACGTQSLCSGPMRCTSPFDQQAAVLIPPVCIERNIQQGPLTAHVGQCGPQSAYLDLCPDWGSAQRIERTEDVQDKGIVIVGAEACLPHSPPPAASAAVELPNPCGPDANCQGPECPAQTVGSDVDHQNSVTLNADCSVDIVTGKGQMCVGAWTGHDTIEAGPITWDRYYCDFPGGPLDGISFTTNNPGPCGSAVDPTQLCPAPQPICSPVVASAAAIGGPLVYYTVSDNCHVDVFVKVDVMDCLWGEGYNKSFEQGPLTVWTWGCRPPYPPVE